MMKLFNSKYVAVFAVCSVLSTPFALFSYVVIDDLEDGTNVNKLGHEWYFSCDAYIGGTSTVTNAGTDGDELVFEGSYTPGYNSKYSAKLSYHMGEPIEDTDGYFDLLPRVVMGTKLAPDGYTFCMSYARSFSFWAKAEEPIQVRFRLETANVTDGAYYGYDLSVGDDWEYYTLHITGGTEGSGELAQPEEWGGYVHYDLSQTTRISWEIMGYANETGTLWIDNLAIDDGVRLRGPELVSPVEDTLDSGIPVAFTWRPERNCDFYELELSRSSDFDSLVVYEEEILDTTFTVSGLDGGNTYFWRVRERLLDHSGPWSEGEFVIANPTSVTHNHMKNSSMSLSINAGNLLTYHLPRRGDISVDLYTLNGRRLNVYRSKGQGPGIHKVQLPQSLASGSYTAVLRAGETTVKAPIVITD
ncbi:fibronectin type III domain-containing protein [Chitinispirillales bacterium ANBcel5]|uniref:fibronectin type III domain-containing protein n=1 Tax=Cellulosispirillum alkaliphilum TaxID=3039283 RepID=UPI002A5321CB|nr:fibronectin type III domain-containing protein [Chitinispirillales bacterium ANBcel5]